MVCCPRYSEAFRVQMGAPRRVCQKQAVHDQLGFCTRQDCRRRGQRRGTSVTNESHTLPSLVFQIWLEAPRLRPRSIRSISEFAPFCRLNRVKLLSGMVLTLSMVFQAPFRYWTRKAWPVTCFSLLKCPFQFFFTLRRDFVLSPE